MSARSITLPLRTESAPRSAPRAASDVSSRASSAAPGDRITLSTSPRVVDALIATVPVAERRYARTAIPTIIEAANENGMHDANQIGYLLATAQHESSFGANMVEYGDTCAGFDRRYGRDDGNRPGTDDGCRFRGRGFVQVTHRGRYEEMSHALGLPDVRAAAHREAALVADPDLLERPRVAARALVVGITRDLFTHNTAAQLGRTIPSGRAPGDADFYHARGLVNGIVDRDAKQIARDAATFAKILAGR